MVQEISKNVKKTRLPYISGDIMSVQADDGKFAVVKILVTDEAAFHGLIYAQLFTRRPRIVNIHSLQLKVAYFAQTRDHFAQLQPELITHKEVTQEELRDYPLWATKISDC